MLGLALASFTLSCGSNGESSPPNTANGGSLAGGASGGTASGGRNGARGGAGNGGAAEDPRGGSENAGGETVIGGAAGAPASGGASSVFTGEPLCPADNWCWEHPLPQGNDLTGVFGTSGDDVWVVGEEGTILHWDGEQLSPVSSGTFDAFTGVWAASPAEAWISNAQGSFLRWSGQKWSAASGQPSDIQSAAAVTGWVNRDGAPVSTVWFAAAMTPAKLSGDAWSVSAPDPTFFAEAAWADENGGLWMGGSAGSLAFQKDGTWTTVRSGFGSNLSVRGIGGDPQGSVWVVGDGGTISRVDSRGVAAAFTSGVAATLRGVWAPRFDEAWAVGDSGTLLHFDGVRWQPRDSGTERDLRAVWGAAVNDVWVVGARGVILHYNGSSWTAPNGETTVKLNAAWGSSLDDVWAVGDQGVILRRQAGRWRRWASPTERPLLAVWGSGPADVWIGGDVVLHWNGTALSVHTALSSAGALSGRAANDLWANSQGVASHWDGASWLPMSRQIAGSIFEAGRDDLWVASIDGEASAGHWNGQSQTWSKWALTGCLALHGSGPEDVWCVGGGLSARIQRWDGAAWEERTSPVRPGLLTAASSGKNQIWFAGNSGALGHCDDASCAGRGTVGGTSADKFAHGAFVAENLTGLALVGEDVFVVGTRGVILRRRP